MVEQVAERVRRYILDGSNQDLQRLLGVSQMSAEMARSARALSSASTWGHKGAQESTGAEGLSCPTGHGYFVLVAGTPPPTLGSLPRVAVSGCGVQCV